MDLIKQRYNAHMRAKKLEPGIYEALIKGVKIADNGDTRWSINLTSGEFEGVQITQRNICSTEGGLNMFLCNLELLSIEGDWEAVERQLQAIIDWPVEIEIVHSDQLDRAGKPYVNVYLTNDMKPKAVMAG